MRPRVLADRNLRILFAGQMTNMLGNTAMIVVLGIWVKDLTGSSGAAGVIYLLLFISSFLAPATGMLVDRFSRRRVLVINDLLTGAGVAALVLVHGRQDVWLMYVVAVGYGISGQIYRAARGGLLHSMVPDNLLGDANGVFSSLSQGLRIVGPAAGAGLYAAWGGGVVALADTGTFVISAASYLMLKSVPDLPRSAAGPVSASRPRHEFLREMVAGARHVTANPVIRRMVLASAVAFSGAGMINVAMFSLVDQGLHRPTAIIGVLASIQGAGSVIAGVSVGRMLRRYGEYTIASIGFLLNGIGLAVASTATLAGGVVGYVAIGLGMPMILVAEITLVQRRTPAELQGRAIAASEAIIDFPFALSIGTGAAVIGLVGFRPIYLGVAAGFTLVGLALQPYRAVTRPEPAGPSPADPAPASAPGLAPADPAPASAPGPVLADPAPASVPGPVPADPARP